ncbi:hypothetical protein [Paenibacillus rhizophilus]|uniref:Large polyvalent protein associated domain-containing protein n=1 Tax=Paenibacillus rhizophilus TaxID=1850366 RepID=A0A3N9P2T0_9BACL|nr:hypothetical protein [Paenibacillus rhizophilus]RQW10049.1 hypothetical protein EH198_16580 [Paenibacillus rhizophilus]
MASRYEQFVSNQRKKAEEVKKQALNGTLKTNQREQKSITSRSDAFRANSVKMAEEAKGTPMPDLYKKTGGMIDMNPLHSTLSRAVAGDPGAVQTYKQSTGVDLNKTKSDPKKTNKFMDAVDGFNAFTDRMKSAATFSGTEAIDRLFTHIGPEEARKATQEKIDRAENVNGGKVADILGSLVPGEAAWKAGGALVNPLVKNAPKAIQTLTRGAAGGTLFQGAVEVGEALNGKQQSIAGRAKDIGYSAALGGAGDLAISGVGAGLQKLLQRKHIPEQGISEILALPEGRGTARQAAAAERSSLAPGTEPIAIAQPPQAKENPIPLTAREQAIDARAAAGEQPSQDDIDYLLQLGNERAGAGRNAVEESAPSMQNQSVPSRVAEEPKPADSLDELDNLNVDETPHPRVRDKLNSVADDWIAQAKAELAKSRNRLSSNPVDIYAQYAKLGAGYMMKGAVKLADFTETMVREFGEEIRPHVKEIFKQAKPMYKDLKFSAEKQELGLGDMDATQLKDLSNIRLNTSDVYRNFRDVFGKNFSSVKRSILDPFDEAKRYYVDTQKNLTKELHETIVKKLGISKGSKSSELVQKYGEGQITLDELKQQAPNNWKNIVKADQWFRNKYDSLLDQVNETVANIYPTRPDKIVPKRQNYYRHFRELNGLSGLKNMFETPSKIDPKLSGISPFTEPKSKWASFKQKRGLGEFKNDAVGGFLEYIPAASYAMHIDPQINVFRTLAKNLAEQTTDSRNVNNFIKFLNNYANDLSGKTSPLDRWVEEIGGRKTLQVLSWANNRVKANVILGNVRSTLSQFANIPQGMAFAKQHSAEGAARTVQSIFQPNEAMQRSIFMRERYIGKDFRQFNTKILEQPKRFAEWMMETSDRVGTSFVWNSAYAKGKSLKVTDAVKYADEHTRRLVAGRGIGEVPLLQKSKVFQVVAPFQLEVANLWKVMKDFVSEKDFVGIATLFAANFLLNKGMEKVTGSGVAFDPIDAIYTAATEDDLSPLERAGRLGGEVLSNLPLGQSAASMYPENGTTLYGIKLPSREKLFGDKDPTRFGEGLVLTKGIQDPLFKMVLPFGGNQIKKTITGADAILRGGAYTENVLTTGIKNEKKELKFGIEKTPAEISRGLLFGAPATSSGQEYYKNDRRPLSEKQTKQYLAAPDKGGFYDAAMMKRAIETNRRKIKEIQKDPAMSEKKKYEEITKIEDKIKQLQQ